MNSNQTISTKSLACTFYTLLAFSQSALGQSSEQTIQQEIGTTDQSGQNKVLRITKTDTPPIIDGIMDEIWNDAVVVDDLHQVEPTEYATPSEKTIIKVLYDEKFIYVSGMIYYQDLNNIVANKMIQGANLRDDDKFRLYINPFNDGRNGYLFQTNANGVRSEAIIEDVRNMNFDWTGIWYSGAQQTDYGWFGEMAIPFNTISFDPNSDSWGISFLRSIKAKSEELAWTSYNRSINPSNFGTATGLLGLEQGLGLDVIPGVSITHDKIYNPNSSETNIEPSLDVFYKITPNLTGALTFNSDFSATDVDARQVQLTRFSLFVPEQRKFFLQEADIFEFGGLEANGKPFFSRRIGIGPSREQLDINAGGKVTGRIGRWNIGALAVQQSGNESTAINGEEVINDSDLFVGRVSANVLEQSTIGAIATIGDPSSDEDNSVIGADFNYLNTRSFDNITLEGKLWYQQSSSDDLDGDDHAWGAKIVSPNSTGLKGKLEYNEIGKNFSPALGFVNRKNIKQSEVVLAYVNRFSSDSWLRSLETFVKYERFTDTDGNIESELTEIRLGEIENQSGDTATLLNITDNREVLTDPFEISDGIIIPIGDYSFNRYKIEASTGGQRELIASISYEGGDFYSGKRSTFELQLDWQPNKYFTAVLEYEYNDIELAEGVFDTKLIQLSTDVAFNSEWAWITTAQFDNQSDLFGVNSRLQWVPKAGQEVYLIYNGGWLDEDETGFNKIAESATIKVGYTLRF